MNKRLLLLAAVFIIVLTPKVKSQRLAVFIGGMHRNIDSIYYRSTTGWFVLTPFMFARKEFSPDYGENWKHAGMLGGHLRPYIKNNPNALKDLNTYSTIRIAGIVQMFVIAPLFVFKEIQWEGIQNAQGPPYPDTRDPGYMWGFVGFLYSGAITYHVISRSFLPKALSEYYSAKKTSSIMKLYTPQFGLGYNVMLNRPMVTLKWNF